MNSAIKVENLCISYRAKGQVVEAVRELTFDVEPGEIVGFLGPNGAGKSSTLKALMGFVQPDKGKSELLGVDSQSSEARRRVGYLPEVAQYYPYLTPFETLVFYGELQGIPGSDIRKDADSLLEQVGIGHARNKQNRQLSKGMLQRVGIAQSLLGSPDLLILDEVTSGLDPVGRNELRELLKSRQSQGATLFFSSHEMSEVEMLCDRILMIDKGRLIEERNMADLRQELTHYSLVFTGNASLVGLTEIWEAGPDGNHATFQTKSNLMAAIERIQIDGGRILDVRSESVALENYFVETIGRAA